MRTFAPLFTLILHVVQSQYGTFKGFPCIRARGTCLDTCPSVAAWPGNCGQSAINWYCQQQNYPRAVGSAPVTVPKAIRVWDNSICEFGSCGSFTSISCDLSAIDECASNPCMNGGACNDAYSSYACACQPGFAGSTCNSDKDECSSNPCSNGICQDLSNQFQCDCSLGWQGPECDIDVDECATAPPCLNGGQCANRAGSYQCQCPVGTDGVDCEINFDECASGPCANGGECLDGINGYACNCPPEYTDDDCGTSTLIWTLSNQFVTKLGLDKMGDPTAMATFSRDILPYVMGPLDESAKESMSWDLEETFEYCFFEGEPCDMKSDVLASIHPKMGSCFTFNHFNNSFLYKGRRAGEANGLRVSFIVQQGENTPWSMAGGVRIFVHNQSDIIFTDSPSIQASPGFVNSLGFTLEEFQYLGQPYGNCSDSPTSDVYYYPLNQGYSKSACIWSCYMKKLMEECGCADPDLLLPPEATYCSIDERTCVTKFEEEHGDPSTWDTCNCPQPCKIVEYDMSVSYAAYQDEVPLCYLVNNRTKCIYDTFTDKITVNVFMQRTTNIYYVEVPAYDFLSLLSELGGILGILAGISVLSLTEIIVCIGRVILALLFNIGPNPV